MDSFEQLDNQKEAPSNTDVTQNNDLQAEMNAKKRAKRWILIGYVSMLSWCIFAGIHIASEMRQQHDIWRDLDYLRRRDNVELATKSLAKNRREAILYLIQELQQEPYRDPRIRLTTGLSKLLDYEVEGEAREAITKLIEKTLMSQETERLVLSLKNIVERESTAEKPNTELIDKLQKIADGTVSLELTASEQNTLSSISADIEKRMLKWREKKALKSFVRNWKKSIALTKNSNEVQNPIFDTKTPSKKDLYTLPEAELSSILKIFVLNNTAKPQISANKIGDYPLNFVDKRRYIKSVMEDFSKSLSEEDEHAPAPTKIEKQTVLFVLIQPISEDLKKEEEESSSEDTGSEKDSSTQAKSKEETPVLMDPDKAVEILTKREWKITKDQKRSMRVLLDEAYKRWEDRYKTWMSLRNNLIAKVKDGKSVKFSQEEIDYAKSFVEDWDNIVDKVNKFISDEGLLSHFIFHSAQSRKTIKFTESEKAKICLLCLRLEKEYNESRYELARAMHEIIKNIKWGTYDTEGDATNMTRSLKSVWLQRDEQMLVGEISRLLNDHDSKVREELGAGLVDIGGPAVVWLKKILQKTKVNPIMAVETNDMSKPERLKLLQSELIIARKEALRAFEEIGVNLVREIKSPIASPQAKSQEELGKIRKSQELRKEHLQMIKETLESLLLDDVVGEKAKEALKRIEDEITGKRENGKLSRMNINFGVCTKS